MLIMNKSDNRIEYITLASVVSAIAVVFLHVNHCFWQFGTGRYWFTANIIESVFLFCRSYILHDFRSNAD